MFCIHIAHLSFDQMHLKSSDVLDNPRFTVLLVIIFMGTRERTYFSVVRRTVLSLGSPVADPDKDLTGSSLFWK